MLGTIALVPLTQWLLGSLTAHTLTAFNLLIALTCTFVLFRIIWGRKAPLVPLRPEGNLKS